MKTGFFSFFRWRIRYGDKWVLAAIPAMLMSMVAAGKAAVITFALIGLWNTAFKRNSRRFVDGSLIWPSFALGLYALMSFGVSVWRNPDCLSLDPNYAAFLIFPFLSAGLVLVRDPLRWLALGAKLVIVYFCFLGIFELFTTVERAGWERGPVISAYYLMLCGSMVRFDKTSSRPINLGFFYLSFIPVLATGTRTALIFYAVMAVIDGYQAIRFYTGRWQKPAALKAIAAATLGLTLVAFAVLQSPAVQKRIAETVAEAQGLQSNTGIGSLRMRYAITKAGVETFLSAPIFGAGLCKGVENLTERVNEVNPAVKHKFFHNMWLDAVGFYGIIGLVLFSWWCFAVVKALFENKAGDYTGQHHQLNLVCFVLAVFIYGVTSSFLSDIGTISGTFIVLAALINEKQRTIMWHRIREP